MHGMDSVKLIEGVQQERVDENFWNNGEVTVGVNKLILGSFLVSTVDVGCWSAEGRDVQGMLHLWGRRGLQVSAALWSVCVGQGQI